MSFAYLLSCFLILDSCSSVRSCLQCDQVVRYIHEDFLSTVRMTVRDQIELKEIIEHAYVNYRETSRSFRGVIDPTTLYRARTEYQSEFKRHWKEHRTGSLQWDMINIVEKGRRILQKHLELFVTQGLCPNKCGLFYQRVMNCTSCQYGLFTCLSATPPIDCGEHHLEADEGEGVVLDCFLPWHTLVVGQTEYYYSWLPAKNLSHEGEYEELVVTEDSKIVLNQLRVNEQGVYRCLLQDQKATTLSRIYFYLKVNPLPSTTPRLMVTLPPLPVGYDLTPPSLHRNSVLIMVILLSVLSITGSLVIIMYLGVTMKQQKEGDSRWGERQDAEDIELNEGCDQRRINE
ncbi:izumo sperm-egg fusion protein 1 [Triplophysa rosa]|uniref:Izumo sperm-egg fusion protein 1-like n=1 Tax=Triplophysa rosa TaxID=992332 RepID=A0A9W7TFK7_TRIRA|nr:izumo sperm-egg fusion protein 1 [Triplophysa rosa]KAI7797758.1 putative izumo sperm-egg fusion protein 1-like [Triplophysa rosa]